MKKQWTNLHHQTLKLIKKYHFENSQFLVTCSGGLDSVALFYLLKELGMQVELCHVHHGGASHYRKKALSFVEKLAQKEKVVLHAFKSARDLKTENAMRDFRKKIWRGFLKDHVVTLAHHQEDLLETRLMRLIRGTGPDGLQAMQAYQGFLFRPFLNVSKMELQSFLENRKHPWLEDPSNQDRRYFRNFIRQHWLPLLEKQKPGSASRLSQSLENLAQAHENWQKPFTSLSLPEYLCLSEKQQIQALALLLKNNGYHQFGLSQLKEVQKQLDKEQKRHTFKCAGVNWLVNAQQISLEK